MKISEQPVFFLDLQTTGAKPDNSSILEIAWADSTSEAITSSLVQLPEGETVPWRIENITGIQNEDLEKARPLQEVLEKLQEALKKFESPSVVIHFASFEKPFLQDAYTKLGQEVPFQIICTHEIAKRLMPNLPTRGIKGLAGYFGFNAGELKRATSHVEATRCIWRGLVKALEEKNLTQWEDVESWLQLTPKPARQKYEYPLPKEKRLSLPDQPGVYRMISQWGEVLYVGKATSLHSRVNSYFRGQKNRDPRKLEMLTQTWDLQVTPCRSPLEAALLETDEIKRLNPRYNISLKAGQRHLVFFNREFTSFSDHQNDEYRMGPFSTVLVFESMMKLTHSLTQEEFDPMLFYEEQDPQLLKEGFSLFCERYDFDPLTFTSLRSVLAVGLWWQRQYDIVQDEESLEEDLEQELAEEAEQTQTPEEIADRFERHFIRAGQAYARALKLTRLLNSDIDFQLNPMSVLQHLSIRRGRLQAPVAANQEWKKIPWSELSIETYDRMSVLNSELEKIKSQDGRVQVTYLRREI